MGRDTLDYTPYTPFYDLNTLESLEGAKKDIMRGAGVGTDAKGKYYKEFCEWIKTH